MKNLTILFFTFMPLLFFGQNNEGLSFESTTYDFGTLSSASKAKSVFQFKNASDSPIEILKIHGENHCIEIDSLSVKRYEPKEKGEIRIKYNTDCKGPIRKTLSVFTSNDNTITLKLIGKVED